MEQKHFMGRWDCETCDYIGNIGTDTVCVSCGAARPEGVAFYLPPEAEEVSASIAERGPDWVCDHCDGNNPNTATTCSSCGNPRTSEDASLPVRRYRSRTEIDTSEEATAQMHRDREADRQAKLLRWQSSAGNASHAPSASRPPYQGSGFQTFDVSQSNPRRNWLRTIGIGLAILTLIAATIYGISWLTAKEVDDVRVIGREYTSWTLLSDYQEVGHSGWSRPSSNAYDITQRSEVHHYDKVFDGYETYYTTEKYVCDQETHRVECGEETVSNGNGTFTTKKVYCDETVDIMCERQVEHRREKYRDEPVYQTKYYWKQMEWVSRSRSSCPSQTRRDAMEIAYPEASTSSTTKVSGHDYTLTLFLERPGHEVAEHTWSIGKDETTWRAYLDGAVFKGYFRQNGDQGFLGPVPPGEE